MTLVIDWRPEFTNHEANELHAEAFDTRVFTESEWNWCKDPVLLTPRKLGASLWTGPGGFVNVLWDGLVHAWLQDLMVAADRRHEGIAKAVVDAATEQARAAGCAFLHVDLDEDLAGCYLGACGFTRTSAGVRPLR